MLSPFFLLLFCLFLPYFYKQSCSFLPVQSYSRASLVLLVALTSAHAASAQGRNSTPRWNHPSPSARYGWRSANILFTSSTFCALHRRLDSACQGIIGKAAGHLASTPASVAPSPEIFTFYLGWQESAEQLVWFDSRTWMILLCASTAP